MTENTEEFKILTARDHLRKRIGMYLGSVSKTETERFVNGVWKNTRVVPALFKCVNEIIDNSVDEAIRTKAEIGSRREATAMATASAAVRKAAALENELGRGRDYKSVKGIPWFLDVFADTPAAYSVAGRKLSDMSRRMDYEIREIEDSRFGSVKAYHVDVIEAFRLALKNDLNMLGKYRLRRAA